ncbi:hypothetical protein ACQ4PT_057216 [Festuca glaucescens]
MAGIIKGYWESTRNHLAAFRDMWRVAYDLKAGGCHQELFDALEACHPRLVDRTPADLDPCVKATAALRRCMQCRPDVFREHMVAMDKSIEEEERLRREPDAKVEDGPRLSWWIGMRNN